MTAFAINVTPPQSGILSADRLRRFVSWAHPSSAVRDIQSPASSTLAQTNFVDPVLEVRLKEIASLAPGWDEGTALPVDPGLIRVAQAFISSDLVTHTSVRPDLVPTFDGGLLFEWHTEQVDLIIEIDSVSAPTFYYHDNELGQEIEAPLGEHVETLTTAFRKLMMIP
jgi:hypothetical protein